MKPGPLNLITDVAGLRVGHADDERLKSGVTVLTADAPLAAGVNVMGGAPGTRETDLLAPDRLVQIEIQAPAAVLVQAQAPALAGCCTLGVGGFGQGQRLGATGRLGVRRAARAQQDSKAQGRYRQTAYAHFQPFGAARATQNILNRRVRREPVD